MIEILKKGLWEQFGASISMLENAIALWPEDYWHTRKKFFYTAYHCLLFLDYYLTVPPGNFTARLPFTIAASGDQIDGEALDDITPDRVYSKKELLDYLEASREKCRRLIAGLTEEKLTGPWRTGQEAMDDLVANSVMHYTVLEILLYNMRHVQHHTAQLNALLRQSINNAPAWIARAEDNL